MSEWPGGIDAITLFVDDLDAVKRFYERVFGLPIVYEDENSAVFKFGETLVNLLRSTEAPGLMRRQPWHRRRPVPASSSRSGSRTSMRCASS
jgi:catechol 2,3-dioxygenase-like lactoylglutathione lyase family enzyme